MTNKFYSAAEKERIAFTDFYETFKAQFPPGYDIYTHITSNKDNTRYDFLVHLYDSKGNKVASCIIECKIRDKHYPTLMLEKKKYNDLQTLKKRELKVFKKVYMLYINFTPTGTYTFNLDKVAIKWETAYCPKQTMGDTTKIDKQVAMLGIQESRDYEYIFDLDAVVDKNKRRKVQKVEAQRCIFESVENLKM